MRTNDRHMTEAQVGEEYGGELPVALAAAREGMLYSVERSISTRLHGLDVEYRTLWDVRMSDMEPGTFREMALEAVLRHFYGEGNEAAAKEATMWTVRRVVLS